MLLVPIAPAAPILPVQVHDGRDLVNHLPRLTQYVASRGRAPLSSHPAWLLVLQQGLQQTPYCLEVCQGERVRGLLPLAFVRSVLFGRFLVSLPYLNYGGVLADSEAVARQLIDGAVNLADQLKVRYLELRHVRSTEHPALNHLTSTKVHMQLALPKTAAALWKQLSAKVRNQIRKGQKSDLTVTWGGLELLPEFYRVFSWNMRDLGTPVYGQGLFRSILAQFPRDTEFCVVRSGGEAVATALLLHGWGITEVPSASSLRQFNHICPNMLMYWHLLERAMQRGHDIFDFGRCSPDSPTYRFKKQWGAVPRQAVWQYYLRQGTTVDMRPENPRFQHFIRIWERLPVSLTRLIGPVIVRGIP